MQDMQFSKVNEDCICQLKLLLEEFIQLKEDIEILKKFNEFNTNISYTQHALQAGIETLSKFRDVYVTQHFFDLL